MIAVMVAKWVGDALEPEGIYDALINLRNYPFLDARETYKGHALLKDIMTPLSRLRTIPGIGCTVGELGKPQNFP
jgi:chloride channel 3/4/5